RSRCSSWLPPTGRPSPRRKRCRDVAEPLVRPQFDAVSSVRAPVRRVDYRPDDMASRIHGLVRAARWAQQAIGSGIAPADRLAFLQRTRAIVESADLALADERRGERA